MLLYHVLPARVTSSRRVRHTMMGIAGMGVATTHIRHDSWISNDIAARNGLDLNDALGAALWRTAQQSFTLAPWMAERKFGPNYVRCKTPLDNVRITTFFAGEHEVKIIDPDRVEFIESVGCRVREANAGDILRYREELGCSARPP